MTTYPSQYQATLKNPIPFYGPSAKELDEQLVVYGTCMGISYIGPYLQFPQPFRSSTESFMWGFTASPEIKRMANILKKLPRGARGGRPNLIEVGDVSYFDSDKRLDYSATSALNFRGATTTEKNNEIRNTIDLFINRGPFYQGTPWPSEGITVMNMFMTSYFQELAKEGATIDALITDVEGVAFGGFSSANFLSGLTSFTENEKFYLPHGGISSWNDILIYSGACANNYSTSTDYLRNTNNWAWYRAAQMYTGENWRLGYLNALQETYPNSISANYDYYSGEKNREDEAVEQNGFFWPQGKYSGNAGSPVLYGRVRHLSGELTDGSCIRLDDSTRLMPWLIERGAARPGPYLTQSPITSFMQAMMELRTAKRNAPDKFLAPWLNSILTYGYASEGHFWGREYRIGYGQSPAEVLHDSWYPVNIQGILYNVGGITSYDGTTTAFGIGTSRLSLISETWYKQNITSLTFDGATTAYEIKTSGVSGTTAALAYYLNRGLTAGSTYVFSYFVDASRGFTGFNARFTTWSTSDSIVNAPSLTTNSGITFRQILPVTGSFAYLQTPIQYNIGDSGWVKLAFEFVSPNSNPLLGLHVYHGANDNPQGYTAYIKDVSLNHQSNGQTLSLSFIGTPNKTQSLEYYYNGVTSGLTYIFSYYVDTTRSYTGSNSLQTLNHFQEPTYYLPLGITYNQILPAVRNSLFHTAGMCYGSATGWVKVSYSFNIPIGDTYDLIHRNTLAASVIKTFSSVMDSNDTLGGNSYFIASPSIEIEGTTTNTIIPVSAINYETIDRWQFGPPIGWCDAKVGPNRRYDMYLLRRGGNSAYYGELVRHCCLNSASKFGFFNVSDFVNFGLTGSIAAESQDTSFMKDVSGEEFTIYRNSGLTQHIESFLHLDSILKDVYSRLGGATTTTADMSRPNWMAPYIASGAPGLNGATWWWRITALPGYTTYCNGVTLSARGTVGMWIGTTGPTLASENIYSTKWTSLDGPQEPTLSTPALNVNFAGMTNINQLIASGFTFSRGGTATYIDSTGKIAYAGPNQPRFDHEVGTLKPLGILLEAPHTNLLNWSQTFASSGGAQNNWVDTNLSRISGNTAPDGLLSAIRFTATAANASLLSSTAVGSSSFRTFSVFMRGITGNESVFYTLDGGTTWNDVVGLTKYFGGINGVTYTIKPSGPNITTSWTRFIFDPTTENHHVGIRLGKTGDSVEIWGAQLETRTQTFSSLRLLATSYIPTTSTTASTSRDLCFMRGSSFSSWYGSTYGSFVIYARNLYDSGVLSLGLSSPATEGINLYPNNLSIRIRVRLDGSVTETYAAHGVITQRMCPNIDYKLIFTYGPRGMKYGSYQVQQNGYDYIRSLPWASGKVGPPPVDTLDFSPNDLMHVSSIRYWPFVFDENTMIQMAGSNIDRSVGWYGIWDDVGPYYNRG